MNRDTVARFCLPDVGEGLADAEIVTWRVAVGDTVEVDDVLVEIETVKSLVELPSPHAGTVSALLAAAGETVAVGTPIVEFAAVVPTAGSHIPPAEPAPPVLVGYGPSERTGSRRRHRTGAGRLPAGAAGTPPPASLRPRATPPVRRLAKDLGVDLVAVTGSGVDGLVTRADVLRHAETPRCEMPPPPAPAAPPTPPAPIALAVPAVPAAPAGTCPAGATAATRIPVTGVRKAIAAAMTASAFTAPHAAVSTTVDVSRTVSLVERLRSDPTFDGCRVTPLLLVARALLIAAHDFPRINACWDAPAREIVQHGVVNLGIAAATPRGLVVPNVKDAGALTLPALARSLTDLVATAREGRTAPADMAGGTITITNVGEGAILCVGAVRRAPWIHKDAIRTRWITTLTLSFDHRLIDGELAGRVLARIGKVLDRPKWELLLS